MNNIDSMKETIKKRMSLLTVTVASISVLIALQIYNMFTPFVGTQDYYDFVAGFQVGILLGIEIIAVMQMGYYIRTLKDDKLVQKLYIKENDERGLLIAQKSGASSYKFIIVILLVAAVISAYFSIGAFIALLGAAVVEMLTRLGLYLYYSKKM